MKHWELEELYYNLCNDFQKSIENLKIMLEKESPEVRKSFEEEVGIPAPNKIESIIIDPEYIIFRDRKGNVFEYFFNAIGTDTSEEYWAEVLNDHRYVLNQEKLELEEKERAEYKRLQKKYGANGVTS